MAENLNTLEKAELAIHRRLNLLNGEELTCEELMNETKGMARELQDIFDAKHKFDVGDFITDGKSKVTVTKILGIGYEVTSQEIEACSSYANEGWYIKFEDEGKWELVESEDVLEEMNNYFEHMPLDDKEYIHENTFQMIARHFIEYGKQHANVNIEDEIELPKCGGPAWWDPEYWRKKK